MKRATVVTAMVLCAILVMAGPSLASQIVQLKINGTPDPSKTATFTFPNYGTATVYSGEYDLKIDFGDGAGALDWSGFCVEDVTNPTSFKQYELVSIHDLGLQYTTAAYLADLWFAADPSDVYGAHIYQAAIWSLIFEGVTGPHGSFAAPDAWATEIAALLASVPVLEVGDVASYYVATDNADIFSNPFEGGSRQDYLIKIPSVPEPATMILIGFSLIGLAGTGRMFRFKS